MSDVDTTDVGYIPMQVCVNHFQMAPCMGYINNGECYYTSDPNQVEMVRATIASQNNVPTESPVIGDPNATA